MRRKLTKCVLADVLESIDVDGQLVYIPERQLIYTIKLNFLPKKYYKHEFHTSPSEILSHTKTCFFKEFFKEIRKAAKATGSFLYIKENKKKEQEENYRLDQDGEEESQKNPQADTGEMHESSDEEQFENDADASTARSVSRHQENQEYDDPEGEELGIAADEREENPMNASSLDLSRDDESNDYPPETDYDDSFQEESGTAAAYSNEISYEFDQEKEEWCSLKFWVGRIWINFSPNIF